MNDQTILTFYGQKPGKTIAIFAGVHGNEIGGILALRQLITELESEAFQLKAGKLHLVFANLQAIARGTRFVDMNMNRAFYTTPDDPLEAMDLPYERDRALVLQEFLDDSDALLDLHSTDHESSPFIICETHSFEVAKKLPFRIVSTGWDAVHAGSTDAYMNMQGKVGVCVECGKHDDDDAKRQARQSIEIFLTHFGLIERDNLPAPVDQRRIHAREIYKAKEIFRLTPECTDLPEFARLKAGTIIGHDGEEPVIVEQDSILIFPKDGAANGAEAFVLGDESPL